MSTGKVQFSEEKVQRLRLALEAKGWKPAKLVNKTQLSKGLVYGVLKETVGLSRAFQDKICSTLELNRDWWETGEPPMFMPAVSQAAHPQLSPIEQKVLDVLRTDSEKAERILAIVNEGNAQPHPKQANGQGA